jgi:membrane associated rhomboid family serine protease
MDMGIHDRDYYRDDGDTYLGNWSRSAQATKALIVITVIAFVIQLATIPRAGAGGEGAFTTSLELIGSKVLQGQVWRLVTCGFLHDTDGILHILFNMIILWLVGRELEERYGAREFVAFYLLALVVSSLAYVGSTALGLNHTTLDTPALGASGAVLAALIVFTLHNPHRRILLFFVLPMPIWALGVFLVGLDLFGILFGNLGDKGDRVAFAAHLGGAAFGALYFLARVRVTALLPSWPAKGARRAKPPLRVRPDEDEEPDTPDFVSSTGAKSDPDVDEHLEAQLDAVLAKVAKQGQESLTTAERAILHRASEVYRKRRR